MLDDHPGRSARGDWSDGTKDRNHHILDGGALAPGVCPHTHGAVAPAAHPRYSVVRRPGTGPGRAHSTILGPQHPSYATFLNNLAEVYRSIGRYVGTERLYKQTLQRHEMAGALSCLTVARW